MSMKSSKWVKGSSYDIGERHAPIWINDLTSTKRFVCYECSINMPDDGIDWPCEQATKLINDHDWDSILLGAFTRWREGLNA